MAYAFNDDKSKFDLDETVDNVDSLIGNMAVIETSPVTTNHSTGEYVMYNGTLFKVLSPIATGENLVLGTNVTPINFGNEVKTLQDSVSPFTSWLYSPDSYGIIPFGAYNTTGQIIEVPDLRSYRAIILRFGYNTGNTSGGGGAVLRFVPVGLLHAQINAGGSEAFECTYYQNGITAYGTIAVIDATHVKILNAQGGFTLRTIYGIR